MYIRKKIFSKLLMFVLGVEKSSFLNRNIFDSFILLTDLLTLNLLHFYMFIKMQSFRNNFLVWNICKNFRKVVQHEKLLFLVAVKKSLSLQPNDKKTEWQIFFPENMFVDF